MKPASVFLSGICTPTVCFICRLLGARVKKFFGWRSVAESHYDTCDKPHTRLIWPWLDYWLISVLSTLNTHLNIVEWCWLSRVSDKGSLPTALVWGSEHLLYKAHALLLSYNDIIWGDADGPLLLTRSFCIFGFCFLRWWNLISHSTTFNLSAFPVLTFSSSVFNQAWTWLKTKSSTFCINGTWTLSRCWGWPKGQGTSPLESPGSLLHLQSETTGGGSLKQNTVTQSQAVRRGTPWLTVLLSYTFL